ncbi:hypothetical protein [Phenylobacterium sp.]|uniref:hypothetical protein n=1 Tax=Phenylobacterium sp. TaxID=1871053 RepID=UPI000C8D79B2|nr:hypothetical protein [Phenylobacterium sp.]MAK81615.1 hypothetical protein [Phenylobacterium sp.]
MGWTAPPRRPAHTPVRPSLTPRPVIAALLALAAAGPALAQSADPIGDLLGGDGPLATAPPAAPETAPAPTPTPSPAATPTPTPAAPPPASAAPAGVRPAPVVQTPAPRPARTIASQPVFLDERQAVAGQLSAEERSYEERLRASFDSAQGLQGPLDGGWALMTAAGQDLYALRFVDRGSGPLEGAWRDARRPGALDGFGFLDHIERRGGQVTLRFTPRRGAPPTVISLSAAAEGQWSGDMLEDGAPRSVVMRRR